MAANEEVASWCERVKTWTRRTLRSGIEEIGQKYSGRERLFRGEVREYAEIPVIHGFRVVQPFRVCYVSLCRWDQDHPTRFNWGEPHYYIIAGDPENDPRADLLMVFQGYFNHLWNSDETVVCCKYDSLTLPGINSVGPSAEINRQKRPG
jgi:hypothetical protein